MGRHRTATQQPPEDGPPSRGRRRVGAVAAVLVLAVGASAFALLRGDLLGARGACGHGTVHVAAVASPDVAPALAQIADRARRSHTKSDGQCLDVQVTARSSAEVADELAHGAGHAPKFALWVPDDGIWVDQAAAARSDLTFTQQASVVRSPVVVGALEQQAERLGWPAKTYTWGELTGAAAQSGLRLGTPDPARTATGLLALAMINNSIARTGGSDADVQSEAAAKLLAQRTAPDEAQAVAALPAGPGAAELSDRSRSQALVLSEQAAFTRNSSGKPPLRLFYPKDGAATLDYPYTRVDERDLSVDQARAADRFLLLLGQDDALRTLTAAGFRAPEAPPAAATLARAGGRTPQPVSASPAPSPSPAELQKLRLMWEITVQSARITTVVDASASMGALVPGAGGQTRLDVTRSALEQALGQFTDRDQIGLWRFATRLDGTRDYQVLVPTARLGGKASGGATQRQRLHGAFRTLQPVPGGSTGLYDTSLAVYEDALRSYAAGAFNAVVVLTDGANEDPGSISLSTLASRLKSIGTPQHPVPMIMIAVGPEADLAACDTIAKATGGAAYRVNDPEQIQAVLLKAVVAAASSAAAAAP
ncbi:substrate-binding domain-containing protein [Streptomyces sp. NPDC020917]|uniref:substrate-binding domain-containing protein n=1 Tax=Streptomyces sp. NPDC020917 TaxID=3365102 RepID=UPI0037B3CD09